jgi:hypothetical protein
MKSLGRALLTMSLALGAACAPPTTRAAVSSPVEAAGLAPPDDAADDDALADELGSDSVLAPLVQRASELRLQVLVAVPTRGEDGAPSLQRQQYRADAEYFYPASAVKLCGAVAALEKLGELRAETHVADLSTSTPLHIRQGDEVTDTTLGDDIERALIVSDNDAFNRLYAFVGRDELSERMARIGLKSVRFLHELGGGVRARPRPVVELVPASGPPIPVAERVDFVPAKTQVEGLLVGNAHLDDAGHLVDGPMDFSGKNRVSLTDLQNLLVMVMRPELGEGDGPRLGDAERAFLRTTLGTLPSKWHGAAGATSLDAVHKPLEAAVSARLPGHAIHVFGKGGMAYGFLIENAYVLDETTGRSFFVAATVYANENDVLNDDRYEYTSIATPFVTRVGELLADRILDASDPGDAAQDPVASAR